MCGKIIFWNWKVLLEYFRHTEEEQMLVWMFVITITNIWYKVKVNVWEASLYNLASIHHLNIWDDSFSRMFLRMDQSFCACKHSSSLFFQCDSL